MFYANARIPVESENVSVGEQYVEDWSQMVHFFIDIPYHNLPGFDPIIHSLFFVPVVFFHV